MLFMAPGAGTVRAIFGMLAEGTRGDSPPGSTPPMLAPGYPPVLLVAATALCAALGLVMARVFVYGLLLPLKRRLQE
jgi:hypothetical protein